MPEACSHKVKMMRLLLNGAITIYECEGPEIAGLLHKQDDRRLFAAFDAIGAALYWMKNEVEADPKE
jgi:hypothetical protein